MRRPPNPLEVFRAAGINLREGRPTPQEIALVEQYIQRCEENPYSLVPDMLRVTRRADAAQQSCAAATEAAEQLEAMLQDLVKGGCEFWHVMAVRETPRGPCAVCQVAGRLQEFALHPDVDPAELDELESWQYVAVHENVVVGTWRDDPSLLADAHGEVVTFKQYADRAAHLVEVTRHGHEDCVVTLGKPLRNQELKPHTRLVLQRDNPHYASAVADAERAQSKFEVPIESIDTRLEDLAGVEEVAGQLIEDILLRVYHTDIRDQFRLQAMRGVLLYSYKPGMGKSKFVGAIARWLHENSDVLGFDVVLYVVKPNETKIMWHGGDAKIMREELWEKIRAREAQPRSRPLIQLVVFDEVDSLGKRGGPGEFVSSSAQHDGLEALLVEMDGLSRCPQEAGPPSHVVCFGMTNRPDRVDDAAKRPGRFGDLVLAMPTVTIDGAENVMAIYARGDELPWYLEGEVEIGLDDEVVRANFLRPALAALFDAVVLRYKTDTQRSIDVTAGEVMANVHFMDAMNTAKKRAAARRCRDAGIPAVAYDDVVDCLLDSAISVANQMEADPQMLIRHLQVKVPVTRVDAVAKQELAEHRYLQLSSN